MATLEQPIGYRFGSFILDLEWGGLIAADGKEKPLRPKSFGLLRLLVENAGRIQTRDKIMTELWPNLFVTENNISQCIRDIRRALGAEGCETLQTICRRGYRFTRQVIAIPREDLPFKTFGSTAGGIIEGTTAFVGDCVREGHEPPGQEHPGRFAACA